MQIARNRQFFKTANTVNFLDPNQCKNYIRHTNQSDDAIINITTVADNSGGPWSIQFILKPLADISSDKKVFSCSCVSGTVAEWTGIYGGYWRTHFFTSADRSKYKIYGHWDLGLQVTTDKIDFEADARDGTIFVNGNNFRDISTKKSSLPDTTYYWMYEYIMSSPVDVENQIINSINMMGVQNHDWGNLWYNFYGFRMWDKTNKLFCDLIPKQINGTAGIYDACTDIFWTKTHYTGSFVFGTDTVA